MKDFIDYEKLERLSEADKNIPLYKKIIKLQEEAGEVAQEFLAWDDKIKGIKTNSSKSASGTVEAVIEEVCDVQNVAIDILNALEMQNPELSEYIAKRFQEKLDKWESKIKDRELINSNLQNEADNEKDELVLASMYNIIEEDFKIKE